MNTFDRSNAGAWFDATTDPAASAASLSRSPRHARLHQTAGDAARFESVAGSASNNVAEHWRTSLERHLRAGLEAGAELGVTTALVSPAFFRARIRSGTIGPLHYCQFEADARESRISGLARRGSGRQLALVQLSGTSRITAGRQVERLRPGQMLLVNELEEVCVDDEGRVEQLLLNLRLPDPAGELPRGIARLEPDGVLGTLTFGWVRDICLAALELPADLADEIGQMLSDLLVQALAAAPTTRARLPRAGIDVRAIEMYIEHRLKDPCLSLSRIAQAFGCSVRTLQRAFSRPGAPSLGRYLWHRRVEACAEILRAPSAGSRSLNEIALDLGFSSAAHFSTMFRGVFGVTPGEYRRGVQEPSRSGMGLLPLQAA